MPPEPKTFSLGLISPRKKKKAKSPKANNPTVFIFAKLLVFLLSSCGCFMRECHSLLWWSLGWLEAGKSVFVEPVGSRTLLVFSPPCLQHAAFPFSEFDLSLKKVQCSGHQGLRASCLGDKGSQDYLRVESDPTPPPQTHLPRALSSFILVLQPPRGGSAQSAIPEEAGSSKSAVGYVLRPRAPLPRVKLTFSTLRSGPHLY